MAGLLSKGITIACRGFTGGVSYEHKITFDLKSTIIEQPDFTTEETPPVETTFLYYNDSPVSLVGKYTNLTQFIGARGANEQNYFINGSYNGGGMFDDPYYKMVLLNNAMNENEMETSSDTSGFVITSDVVSVVSNSGGNAWTTLTNLQEIAELGNNAREKIDVTTLDDDAKQYIDGLSDTAQDLPFKFVYEPEQFKKLAAMEGVHEWRVTLPDGTTATFNASPSVKLAGAGTSAAVFYTLTLSVTSEIVFA